MNHCIVAVASVVAAFLAPPPHIPQAGSFASPGQAGAAASASQQHPHPQGRPRVETTPPHRQPPHPGSDKCDEIMANFRAGLRNTSLLDDDVQLRDQLLDPKATKVTRCFFVYMETDPAFSFYNINIDTAAGRPLAAVQMRKASGTIAAFAKLKDTRFKVPDIDQVTARLKERYGKASAFYVYGELYIPGLDTWIPPIAADTPRGRVFVSAHLDVFEEDRVVPDPPGLSRQQFAERRTRQRSEGPHWIRPGHKNEVVFLKHAGTIQADYRSE